MFFPAAATPVLAAVPDTECVCAPAEAVLLVVSFLLDDIVYALLDPEPSLHISFMLCVCAPFEAAVPVTECVCAITEASALPPVLPAA